MREHQHRDRAFRRAHDEVRHDAAVEDTARREASRRRRPGEPHARPGPSTLRERRGASGAVAASCPARAARGRRPRARSRRAARRRAATSADRDARDEARRDREEPPPRRDAVPRGRACASAPAGSPRARAGSAPSIARSSSWWRAQAGQSRRCASIPASAGEGLGADAAPEFEAGHHGSGSGARPSCWRRRARARNSRVSTAPCCMPIMSAISCVE